VTPADAIDSADTVVRHDLEHLLEACAGELARMAGKRLLITGGAGFLGYYLVQAPLAWNERVEPDRRIEVTVFDNYVRGMPGWLHSLEGTPGLVLRRHDVRDPLPADLGAFQFVVHAAGIASPIYYRQHPIETMDANINGLRALLDYTRERAGTDDPVEGFLFFSSSEIYGDPTPDAIPTPETYRGNVSCTGPRACYDESKRYGETLCVNFALQYGLPVAMARPFNNYGPGLKITDRRVIPDFARNILRGEDIVMLSDGAATRTFCYVADSVGGYLKALVRGRPGEAYNVGVEKPEISMAELAERMVAIARERLGYDGSVVHRVSSDPDYLVDNPSRRCPVIEKARAELGYEPAFALEDGLLRSLIWYRDNSEAADA
jgi:nucleoside-diphosphate-sugar epimerase